MKCNNCNEEMKMEYKSPDLSIITFPVSICVYPDKSVFFGTNGRKLFMDLAIFLPYHLPHSKEFQDLLQNCSTYYCIFSPLYLWRAIVLYTTAPVVAVKELGDHISGSHFRSEIQMTVIIRRNIVSRMTEPLLHCFHTSSYNTVTGAEP